MPASPNGFLSTRWTWVEAAGGADSERAREALAQLCQEYWYPLYAYVRRLGSAPADAEDVVQGFFARLIERRDLSGVSREESGRFRAFLLVAIKNHLANVRSADAALKRGGGRVRLGIDVDEAERRFELEAAGDAPERAYDRAWAREVLLAALAAVRAEYAAAKKQALFDELAPHLQAGAEFAPMEASARRLGLTPVAARVALHRLRKRYRAAIEAEVAATLGAHDELGDELDLLLSALGA
jgi:RNA polymerase sigma-70 factor (ECF subfamily)